jgi:hypothetical protein
MGCRAGMGHGHLHMLLGVVGSSCLQSIPTSCGVIVRPCHLCVLLEVVGNGLCSQIPKWT